ncbi:PWWP domain-containing protein 2A isoform X1 [Helicoverpa armigera]|uniref:PWWP domain-containing protein 2A isoform X1 n=1 Tax=Helicoverpa armigera TaxID=29058 RepID=UPI0021117578|nr:PWWP domain-containing protein 2A isoform X1 [Helicoverpa armigera]
MAAVVATADMTIQKNSQILVNVEEALADLIVVSYCTDDKKFQGVLLDSNKGNLPFGVYSLNPAFSKQAVPTNESDKLHSVSQRFTYQEPQYEGENSQKSKKPGPKGKQQQKMTVRLRPRKVLCSNCQGICNENNENVDVSKKRKMESDDDTSRLSESSRTEKKYLMGSMLIPKLSRLQPSEITSAVRGAPKVSNKASEKQIKSEKSSNETVTQELAFVSVSDDLDADKEEDMKDENDISFSSMFSSAKTLKICFGEGEGTVVKIPPLTGDFNEDSGVSCDMGKPTKPDSKAAKKALKKAKKQAKKTSSVEKSQSMQSPKHIGALSPHNNASSPTLDPLEKKHKHKVKHKKKYKNQKKRDENTSKCTDSESVDYFSDIKEHCMNQKLSISLRRLSSNSHEKQIENDPIESGSDDCDSEMVPDFPTNGTEGVGGRLLRVSPGDVVWGKVVGFPWWPGRVLSVTPTSRAHVAWYASTTSSLMPCDSLSPFLEDFKIRFLKKKRGPYKEAVKQATIEAKKNESHVSDPLASPTHTLATVSPRPIDVFS